jgi:hypothetical protein
VGKQQKFPLALIDHLSTILPSQATVVIVYNIGCILAQTLSKVGVSKHCSVANVYAVFQYDILSENTVKRLCFATTVMHAYGHEWACQLVFNPHLLVGFGLSDGEGTERLWSHMIKLIGVERSLSVRKEYVYF